MGIHLDTDKPQQLNDKFSEHVLQPKVILFHIKMPQ